MNINNSVIENFFLITKKFSSRIALNVENKNYTYSQLLNNSIYIFNKIKNEEDKTKIIAIDFKRSFNQISSLIACLIGRKSFIILDEKMTHDKKKIIIQKLNIKVLLTDNDNIYYKSRSLKTLKISDVYHDKKLYYKNFSSLKYSIKDIVYYIFTSGSTGEPKGLKISNKNLVNFVNSCQKTFKINRQYRFILLPQLSFDLSVFPLWVSLLSGSTLYYPNSVEAIYPAEYINKHNIEIYCSVPSQINVIENYLKNSKYKNLSVVKSIFCGEPLYYSQTKIWNKYFPNSNIFNTYGPSETTCFNTFYKIKKKSKYRDADIVSIGKPMVNNKIKLINKEIYIYGSQVSSGYIDKKHTKLNFLKKNNISFYKTGDFAKKINGNYYFIGRKDNQIKFMGYRIELGEIENKLSKIFNNKRVYVFFKNNNICAAIERIGAVSKTEFFEIKKILPDYMIPKKIINFKNFPNNKNFKIDKKKINDAF